MSARKRSRSAVEESRAECPFSVSYPTQPRTELDRSKNASKKRKREEPDEANKSQLQISPFDPTGKFKTNEKMDLHFVVEPRKRWFDMTRYNSFVLNGTKYYSEGFVCVANDSTIERQKTAPAPGGAPAPKKNDDDWVARILEIRAADEHHVYARIYWMYSPDELPPGTIDGKKTVQGRQPYHGQKELIASNHMDIINVVSVTMPARVNQWIEADDEEIQDAYYWRQAYDFRTGQLSSVDLMCKCDTPANPDKTLIGCSNSGCGKWMHAECITHEVLMRVYEQLGNDKPHRSEQSAVKDEKAEERTARPLSPTDIGEKETQPTIDVRSGESQGNVVVRKSVQEGAKPTEVSTPVPASTTVDVLPKTSTAKKGRSKKKVLENKPYKDKFQAVLKLSQDPTVYEVEDLRANVTGGDKTWTERAHCLFCGSMID